MKQKYVKQCEDQNDIDDEKVISENAKGEESSCERRTEYFQNSVIDKVMIYDALYNEGVN